MKNEINDNANISANSKQLEVLKEHFPNCFDKDGAFQPHKLEELVKASGADITKEGYTLNWLGKSYARLLANENVRTLLAANTEHNKQPENANSENLLIQGDNLEVLKHLKNAYREKVKMIYIDPPYNTGSDGFVYADDRKFTPDQLSHLAGIDEDEAKRILEFTQSKSNSHSAWLTFMFPRLYIARELLREDGVIFISIDDNEQAQIKLLCDEVFGEDNFLGKLVVLSNPKGRSQDKYFATNHEYALAYSKSSLGKGELSIEKSNLQLQKEYRESDRGGAYRPIELRNTHREFGQHNRPNMYFPIYARKDGFVDLDEFEDSIKILPIWDDGHIGCWTWDKKKAERDLKLLQARWITSKDTKEKRLKIFRKSYAAGSSRMLKTYLASKEFHTEKGQAAFDELFHTKEKIFQSPKPLGLLKELLSTCVEDENVALDFFSGSGSTAHAVMTLNAEDGGNRKCISVQLDEPTGEGSEARKAGYETIFEITCERIKRAAAKLKIETPEAKCDFGFKEFKTIPANEGAFKHYLDDAETMEQFEAFEADKLSKEQRDQLMLTWQVYDGLPLHLDLKPVDLGGYTANQGEHILYFMASGLELKHIVELLERIDNDKTFAPRKLVVLGDLLSSKTKREITEAINSYNNRKGIELTLDIRF